MNYFLAKGLAERGHEVHLICCPNRKVLYGNVKIHPIPSSYGLISYDCEWKAVEWYGEIIQKSDVVIDASSLCLVHEALHWYLEHRPHVCYRNGIEFLHPRIGRHNVVVLSHLARECALKGISAWQGSKYEKQYHSWPGRLGDVRVINYGIPLDLYEPCYEKDDYLLYLGRFHPAKGVYEAIELAREKGFKLIVAGSTEFPDHMYHYSKILELTENMDNVTVVPDPSFSEKMELLKRAKALIYPLQYREAFGLVIIEALACGTPVLTYKRWTTPELHPGILELSNETLEMVLNDDVKYEDCRRFAEKFSVDRMIDGWEKLLKRVADGEVWG